MAWGAKDCKCRVKGRLVAALCKVRSGPMLVFLNTSFIAYSIECDAHLHPTTLFLMDRLILSHDDNTFGIEYKAMYKTAGVSTDFIVPKSRMLVSCLI